MTTLPGTVAEGDTTHITDHNEISAALALQYATEPINLMDSSYGVVGNGSTDDTSAVNSVLAAAKTARRSVYVPGGYTFLVSNLTWDWSSDTVQSDSGTPYGIRAPSMFGSGKRVSTFQQKTGSTGAILTITGETGTASGPGTNNKVSGMTIRDVEFIGVSTGSHGVSIRSFVDCSMEDVLIRNCGGSGIYLQRETFTSGVDDEYGYGLNLKNVKSMVNARYGIECSGTNAISAYCTNVDTTSNTLGGVYANTTTWTMVNCLAISNGTGSSSRYGMHFFRNSNLSSTNTGPRLIGCRFEGNSTTSGYDLRIDSGYAPSITGCDFFSTSGAHSIGLGLTGGGSNYYVQYPHIGGGTYFSGDGATTSAKFVVTGSDCRNLLVTNPRIDYSTYGTGGNITPNSLMTDNGALTSVIMNSNIQFNAAGWIEYVRQISTPGAAASGEFRNYIKDNGSGSVQWAAKFPTGSEIVLAEEGIRPFASTAYYLNGANTRESVDRRLSRDTQALTSGTIYVAAIPLLAGDSITTLTFNATVALTRGSTAGTAHLWAALYDTSLNLLAQSTDEGNSSAWATGFKSFTIATQSISTTGVYCAVVMANAGSGGSPVAPTIAGITLASAATSTGTGTQKALSATYAVSAPYGATAPSTITTSAALAFIPHAAAS